MIQTLLKKEEVTELIFQDLKAVIIEENGKLRQIDSVWKSEEERDDLFSSIYSSLPKAPSYEHPFATGIWEGFRVQVASPPATGKHSTLQLRRISNKTLYQKFNPQDWQADDELFEVLYRKIKVQKENFLIIGPTGSGKTTLLKSLMLEFCKKDRVICLEDTPELPVINKLSSNLKTFTSSTKEINDITLDDLLKASLRLRPDRLIMGEMRGAEASSFLLVLSTGHSGSAATLHANNCHDALRRLEMLSQMGSPWSLDTIRRLIYSSLDFVISTARNDKGERYIESISEIRGLEEEGFLIHPLYKNNQFDKSIYSSEDGTAGF